MSCQLRPPPLFVSGWSLKAAAVREHQTGVAQDFELQGVVGVELVADHRDDGGRKTVVVQGNFVFVGLDITVQNAGGQLDEQLGHTQQAVELLAGVYVNRRLPERVAEQAHAAQAVSRQLLVQRHERHMFVLRTAAPVVGVGGQADFTPVCRLGSAFDG